MRSRLAFVLSAIVLATPTWAASRNEPVDPEDSTYRDLMELLNTPVSTASKRAERMIESPSVVSVVTREQFQAYGWTTINDALYSLPGFGPSQDYDRKTVSSRGLFEGWNNNHILLLVDGIPYNDNIYGSAYTWDITPVFMIKTLEVVRGPGSALYGSNSTNSATQIKTISPADLPGGGEAQVRMGQRGERIYDVAAGRAGDLFSAVVAVNSQAWGDSGATDYDGSLRTDAGGRLLRFPIADSRDSQYAWAKVEGEGDLKGLSFQFHHQAWNYKTGHGWLWHAPDQGENLQEKRQILSVAYRGRIGASVEQEYMLTHQRHDIHWDLCMYPAGGYLGYYPDGVRETLDTGASSWFARAQWSLDLPREASLLFGMEGNRFLYSGDREHLSNNLMDFPGFTPAPGNATVKNGPWLGYLRDQPLLSTGFYLQASSGKLLGPFVKVVLGLRSDRASFDYHRLDPASSFADTGQKGSRTFSNTSPRAAVIFMPTERLAVKVMYGRAFRAPAPSELAGASTLTLGSNIEALKPEKLSTLEVAVDWIINANLNWRTNIYRTRFKDQILYSAANANLSTNIYSATTEGLETELLLGMGPWKGYVNYAFARRTDEGIQDISIAPSPDDLTWEPAHRFKAGVTWAKGRFSAALNGMYQGSVKRRSSDVGLQPIPLLGGTTLDVDPYRPRTLDAWTTVDLKAGYALAKSTSLSLVITNATGTEKNRLVKVMPFPFDYQGEKRRVSLVFRTGF